MLRTRLLLATLWAGSLWSIGYLAAPTLFATLNDKMLAGSIAGSLFRTQDWLSIFCAVMLFGMLRWGAREISSKELKILLGIILSMLGCTLLLHFGLHPLIAGLRGTVDATGFMPTDIKKQFGILHGLSSGIYMIESLLAVLLIMKIR